METARTISGTREASKAMISTGIVELAATAPEGAEDRPPREELTGLTAVPAAATVDAAPLRVRVFDVRPGPTTVTASEEAWSPYRARSIARCARAPNSSESRGLSLYAGSKTPVHRTEGSAAAR